MKIREQTPWCQLITTVCESPKSARLKAYRRNGQVWNTVTLLRGGSVSIGFRAKVKIKVGVILRMSVCPWHRSFDQESGDLMRGASKVGDMCRWHSGLWVVRTVATHDDERGQWQKSHQWQVRSMVPCRLTTRTTRTNLIVAEICWIRQDTVLLYHKWYAAHSTHNGQVQHMVV